MDKIESPWYFDRHILLLMSLLFGGVSLWLSCIPEHVNLFSSSGAVITFAGLFLNIKHTLIFHRNISLHDKYNRHRGNFGFANKSITEEQKNEIRSVISDEKYGVAFMVVGTLIWAYGTYLVQYIQAI